jgi:hypothetical protein
MLAAVTHLRIDRGDDPIRAGAAVQPRDPVVIDVECWPINPRSSRCASATACSTSSLPACSTAGNARSASSATRESIRSRSAFSRQR